jgi:MotA/TolQ/ExbB proton channel family
MWRPIFRKDHAQAPAFGMIGTLIGMVQMFANMTDPSELGPFSKMLEWDGDHAVPSHTATTLGHSAWQSVNRLMPAATAGSSLSPT